VAAYALVLLAGLVRLAQGEAAFEAWVDALHSPLSILAHLLLLAAFAYHTVSWFGIMPKTMAPVVVRGHRLAPATITGAGIAAAGVLSIAMLLAFLALAA
jgi:fumarate reductase subunit C